MSIYMSRAELEEISEGLITAYANLAFWQMEQHCSLRPPAVANAFCNGRSAEQNGRPYLIN